MRIDRDTLEEAARLLLGPEYKRPLAKLLGPHHPNGERPTLDPRLPFRWLAPAVDEHGEPNRGWRPIPDWVGPVIADLLDQRSAALMQDAMAAKLLANRIKRGEG